jgi:hypothetical protein
LFERLTQPQQKIVTDQLYDTWARAGTSVPIGSDNFLNLPPLTEVSPFDTKHPHAGFASHRQESIKGQGRSLRMPEHLATGSSANYNYASVQKDSQSWHQHRECFRQDVELIDLRQTFGTFLSIASVQDPMLSSIFTGKVFPIIPNFYWKEEEHADPVKQRTADAIDMRMGILSHSDVMMKRGKDPERQKTEVKSDFTEMKNYTVFDNGIPLAQLIQLAQSGDNDENAGNRR